MRVLPSSSRDTSKLGLVKGKNPPHYPQGFLTELLLLPKNGPGSPDCEKQSCGFATEGVSAALC